MRKLNLVLSLAILVSGLATQCSNAIAQEKSLRQEREDKRNQLIRGLEQRAFCTSYFNIDSNAAELLELKGGYPRDEVRAFVSSMGQPGNASIQLQILNDFVDAVSAEMMGLACQGDSDCVTRAQEGQRRGAARGKQAANVDGLETVKARYLECKEATGFKPPQPPAPTPPVAPPPKPTPKKDQVDNILDDILKNNDNNPPIKTPQQSPQRPKEITRQAAMTPEFANVVTASEVEGVRQKIRPCWNSFKGARNAPVVSLVVELNRAGVPTGVEFKEPNRLGDPTYKQAAESARKAVLNPKCHPWPLSPEKYDFWHTVTFNFDPLDY